MLQLKITPEQITGVIENSDFEFTQDGDEFYRFSVGNREVGVVIVDETRIRTVFVIK